MILKSQLQTSHSLDILQDFVNITLKWKILQSFLKQKRYVNFTNSKHIVKTDINKNKALYF